MHGRPSCTLFPYTTLFRSAMMRVLRSRLVLDRLRRSVQFPVSQLDIGQAQAADQPHLGHGFVELADRKSTRLNSSHRCISYAVFCLKKKTCTSRGWRFDEW